MSFKAQPFLNRPYRRYRYDDGGRKAAGFSHSKDCCARAFAIAAGLTYSTVHAHFARHHGEHGECGVRVGQLWFKRFARTHGFVWVSSRRLPKAGRCVVAVRGEGDKAHVFAIVNGIVRDTTNCCADDPACVVGYWRKVK